MSSSRHVDEAHRTENIVGSLPTLPSTSYIYKKNAISVCTIHIGRRCCYIIMKRKANVCKRQAAEYFLWRCFVECDGNAISLVLLVSAEHKLLLNFLFRILLLKFLTERDYIFILEQNRYSGCDKTRLDLLTCFMRKLLNSLLPLV